jgi:hypothetical protein
MRFMNIPLILLAVCVLALLFVGCTHNRPHRTVFGPIAPGQGGADYTKAVIERTSDYTLGFVEFDEQGWFWDRRQVDAVEGMIRTEAGIGQSNGAPGIVILVFVHGWKNNAAYDNANVEMFRTTLTNLDKAEHSESRLEGRAARKIVGVYGGWRGLSAKLEPAKELSFWERKNTAEKVGHGAVTELLVDLENLQKEANNRMITSNAPRTDLIIVGHSFGGGAVYSAISQIVTERLVDTVKHNRSLKPLGDLVILLNPAIEASRHYTLNELAVSITNYPASQRPVMGIFTSEGDWATHYFFPMGRFFSTVFEKNRHDKPQRAANLETIGWFTPFITHSLVYDTNDVAGATRQSTYNAQTQKHEFHDKNKLDNSSRNVRAQRQKWHPNATTPAVYTFDECDLSPKDTYRPGDPFLIVSVDKKIMKDHDDITNPILLNFLREFIYFCHTNPQKGSE